MGVGVEAEVCHLSSSGEWHTETWTSKCHKKNASIDQPLGSNNYAVLQHIEIHIYLECACYCSKLSHSLLCPEMDEKWKRRRLWSHSLQLAIACCERRRKLQKSDQNNKSNWTNRIFHWWFWGHGNKGYICTRNSYIPNKILDLLLKDTWSINF